MCCEIALRPYQFCNLCEVNVSDIKDQQDLNDRVKVASFFGTLQAGFTDFHYLRDIWRKTTEKDALIGVGMTGIASKAVLDCNLQEAAKVVKNENERISKIININSAARCTTIKPSGTSSCVLGTSSGIHAWHNDYYIRRVRVMKNEAIYTYLSINNPELIEDDYFRAHDTAIISIPQMAPKDSILRDESALDLLERVKKFNLEWVKAGHRRGDNTNNVSATISIDKGKRYQLRLDVSLDDEFKDEHLYEWEAVGNWMWSNKDTFNGLSVLPKDLGTYIQAPFTDCTKEEYEALMSKLKDIDLTKVIEIDDNTDLSGEIACGANGCEIK